MHYYLLGFGYYATDYEDTENFNSDFELGHDSYYLIAAEQYVKKLAESHKVDLRHAYSWPDGSLFKYLRSERPLSSWELRDWFRGDEPHTYQTSETKYQVSVYLSSVVEVDGNTVHLTEYLSLAERWALSREEARKLYQERHQLIERFYDEYRHHRSVCPKCSKPPSLPCEEGWQLCKKAAESTKKYLLTL